jgi:hypothetical protein
VKPLRVAISSPPNGIGVKPDGGYFEPRHHAVHGFENVSAIVLDWPVNIAARTVLRQSVAEILIRLIQSLDAFLYRNEFVDIIVAENERQTFLLGIGMPHASMTGCMSTTSKPPA